MSKINFMELVQSNSNSKSKISVLSPQIIDQK